MIGKTIGNRYNLQSILGAGGMGQVYRAFDRLTGHIVALKHVTVNTAVHSASDPSTRKNRTVLAQEFRTLAGLRHPNIITVLDYGFDEDQLPYYTMNLLEDAQTIVHVARDLPRPQQIDLLVQMLRALAYLHRRGIVHRDLKPANVLVTQDGQLHVLDFGLATTAGETNEIAGTIAYIAPEVLRQRPVTPAADLYAAGIIAYQVLTGHHPFDTSSTSTLISQIIRGEVDLTRLSQPDTGNLPAVIGRMVALEPADRYTDVYTAIQDLSKAGHLPIPPETSAIRESFLQAARFVGRETELNRLTTALKQLINTQVGSGWLIGGESGVGKSRLLDELRIQALVQGVTVVRGQALSDGGATYQLWRDVVRQMLLFTPVTDFQAGVLSELVPDIATLLDRDIDTAPTLNGTAANQRIRNTVIDLFRMQVEPMVLLIEDLQWADESLSILEQLSQIAQALPVMIVANYRDDERPSLPDALMDMTHIPLSRLTPETIADLSASMLGDIGTQPHVVELLNRETEGNVFFVVEVLRALAEEAGSLRDIGNMTLPQGLVVGGIQKIISRRLERVPPDGQDMLKLAAIIGRWIDPEILKTAITLAEPADFTSPADLNAWFVTCTNAAVFEGLGNQWRFAHDKLREHLLASLTDDDRVRLSRLAARAIETLYPDDENQARTLTDLWGVVGDPEKERTYAIIAGKRAVKIANYLESERLLKRAFALTPDDDMRLRASILFSLAEAYRGLGYFDEALSNVDQSIQLAEEAGDIQQQAHAYNLKGMTYHMRGIHHEGLAIFEKSVELARQSGDLSALGTALAGQANILWQNDQAEEGIAMLQEALKIREQLNEHLNMAINLNNIASAYNVLGEQEVALEYYDRSLNKFKEIGYPAGVAFCHNTMGSMFIKLGDYDTARMHLEEARKIYNNITARYGETASLEHLTRLHLAEGDIDAAHHTIRQAIIHGQAIGASDHLTGILTIYSELLIDAGYPENAALLWGATHALRPDQHYLTATLMPIRGRLADQLDAETLDTAINAGEVLSLQELLSRVLTWLDERANGQASS